MVIPRASGCCTPMRGAPLAAALLLGPGCFFFEEPRGRPVSNGELCARLSEAGGCDSGEYGCVSVVCWNGSYCPDNEQLADLQGELVGPKWVDIQDLLALWEWCGSIDNSMNVATCTYDGDTCDPGSADLRDPGSGVLHCPEEWYAKVSCEQVLRGPL